MRTRPEKLLFFLAVAYYQVGAKEGVGGIPP
jgi:hypothetical protein